MSGAKGNQDDKVYVGNNVNVRVRELGEGVYLLNGIYYNGNAPAHRQC